MSSFNFVAAAAAAAAATVDAVESIVGLMSVSNVL